MIKLTIRTGAQAGMEFPMDRPSIRIGRGSGNDIVLQDSQASRHHAEITEQGGQYYVRDLGSTNGTIVNNQRISGSQLLKTGDQIQVGETTLSSQIVGVAAAPVAGEDWESQLWDDTEAQAAGGRSKALVWGLVGLVAVLLVAVVVVAVLLLGGGDKETPTPIAEIPTQAETEAVVVAPSPTPEPELPPTSTPLVEVPTMEPVPTVELQPTSPPAQPPPAPKPPEGAPTSPEDLEKLPAEVTQYLGDVPPEQLPEALAQQIQSMPPEQVQEMIGALFPGVAPEQLPQVVAASFPGLSEQDVQGLLALVFPGQNIQMPGSGSLGGTLALSHHREGVEGVDLYLANVSNGQLTQLVTDAQEPDFSPNGQWLVYVSYDPTRLGMRLIKVDGSGDTQLTAVQGDRYPSFSPDGQRIVFHNGGEGIVVINRDGSGRRSITNGEYPAWSPTGDQIVYRGCVSGGQCGLVVASADGSNPRQITTHANDAAPRWSPNGGQIAFHSDRDGNWECYVINSDGTWLRRITLSPATDVMPVWSPNGLQIAFLSDRGGTQGVYVTSGIGGGAFKHVDVSYPSSVGEWLKMDWTE
jgi:hypothetical protein